MLSLTPRPLPPPFLLQSPPPRRLLLLAAKRGAEDDYHATIRTLNANGRRHAPRKSLGQHYMLNSGINDALAGVAGVEEGDVVLEIGPGTGSLTNALINAGATVIAVEKVAWYHIAKVSANITLDNGWVVSNIPFNISTEVVKKLLPLGDVFSDVALLLQDETAIRLSDVSLRSSECRPINIFVNFYSDPQYKSKVERTNFFPQPNVDAAIIRFKLKQVAEYPPVTSPKSFFSMINSAFNGKRKMLRKSLQHICPSVEIEAALTKIGLPVTVSYRP
ncbi:Ribosomal RNA small subunit methyltransferase, chloroplastic, partial [Ananas comosus]